MRKTFILFLSLLLVSCNKNETMNQIEENIKSNSLGVEIGYVKGKEPEEKIFKFKDIINIYKNFTGDNPSVQTDAQIKAFKEGAEIAKKDNNIEEYWALTGKYKVLESWKNLKPDETVYKIYKYTYKIDNLLAKGEKRNITNYYIFDKNDKLITKMNDSDVEEIRRQAISSPDSAFLIAVMKEYGKPNKENF